MVPRDLRIFTCKLKDQMAELLSKMNVLSKMSSASAESIDSQAPRALSAAAVVKKTINSTMEEEKVKSDLMISNLDDDGNDERCMKDLCTMMNLNEQSRPMRLVRVGKKKEDRKRLLKASFNTQFDARKFKASYEEAKKNETPNLPSVRVRRCRTKEEETTYKSKIKRLKELNDLAKEEGDTTSFSLRDNGLIWKYVKDQQSGKWRRDVKWSEEQNQSDDSGNRD